MHSGYEAYLQSACLVMHDRTTVPSYTRTEEERLLSFVIHSAYDSFRSVEETRVPNLVPLERGSITCVIFITVIFCRYGCFARLFYKNLAPFKIPVSSVVKVIVFTSKVA